MISRKLAVFALISVLVAAGVAFAVTESGDAATQTNLNRVSAQFITDLDSEYDDLVYLNDKLPTELNPAEWVQDSNGLWYNVNEHSYEYGNVLTYGAISDVTPELVRSDVLEKYTFSGSGFQLLQVKYTVQKGCNFSISVSKDGMADKVFPYTENYLRAGYTFTSSYQSAVILTVDSTGDLNPSEARGTYEISVDSNGDSCYSQNQELVGNLLDITGKVVDKGGNPISCATVYYDDGYSSNPSVSTDSTGTFTIRVSYGSTVFIQGISADNYSFDSAANSMTGDGYSCGKVVSDKTLVEPFTANEHTVSVKVLDMSDRPVADQELAIAWFQQSGTGPYIITSTDVEGNFVTDSEGKCSIVFKDPENPDMVNYLYVCLTGTNADYSWEVDTGIYATGSATPDPLKSVLEKDGNLYVDIVGYSEGTLRVKQYSVEVTVTGADSTKPISGIAPDVEWFVQNENGGIFTVDVVPSGAWSTSSDSKVWADVSDNEGKSIVHFCKPTVSADPKVKYYLLVAGSTPIDSSIAATFSFSVGSVTGESPAQLADRVSAYAGMECVPYDLSGTFAIEAKEKAFTYTYNLTVDSGDVLPDYVDVICDYGTGTMSFTSEKTGSVMAFSVTVKKGTYLKLTVNASGYYIPLGVLTTANIEEDTTQDIPCSSVKASVVRDTPVTMPSATTKVTGLSEGDQVSFSFISSGNAVKVTLTAVSDTVEFTPNGWASSMVTDMVVTLMNDNYLYSTGSGEYASAVVKDINFVTYNSDSLPMDVTVVCQNINITAYLNGEQIASKKSTNEGIGTITVPDVPGIVYKYGNYTVTPENVTDGPFSGCIAFNLQGIVDVVTDTYITLTVKYIASSVGTDGVPTFTDLKPSEVITLRVGDTIDFTAVEEKHFYFGGWTLGAVKKSGAANPNLCNIYVTEDLDGLVLTANYSAYDEPVKEDPLDMTSVSLGMIGIILSILAFAYVITQVKRY